MLHPDAVSQAQPIGIGQSVDKRIPSYRSVCPPDERQPTSTPPLPLIFRLPPRPVSGPSAGGLLPLILSSSSDLRATHVAHILCHGPSAKL